MSRTAVTAPPAPWTDDQPGITRTAVAGRNDDAARLSVTPASDRRSEPPWTVHGTRTPTRPPATSPTGAPRREQDLYLKQNGQVYAVRDWETLERWIVERRVDAADLISIGGVRWEPVGNRADLVPLLPADAWGSTSAVTPPPPPPAPAFPTVTPSFLTDAPFQGTDGWTDEDADGIPLGIPPLHGLPASADRSPDAQPLRASTPAPERVQERGEDVFASPPSLDPTRRTPFSTPLPPSEEPTVDAQLSSFTPISGEVIEAWSSWQSTPAPAYAESEPETSPTVPYADSLPPEGRRTPTPAPPPAPAYTPAPDGFDEGPSFHSMSPRRTPTRPPPPVPAASPRPTPRSGSTRPDPRELAGEIRVPAFTRSADSGDLDAEWADELAPGVRSGTGLLLVGGALTAASLVAVGVLVLWPNAMWPRVAVPEWSTEPPPAAPLAAAPSSDALAAPEPAPPKPTATTTVSLSPVASGPRPVTPRPADLSLGKLLERAWQLADEDRAKSALLFQKGLSLSPGNDESHYGLGYVRLMQGRVDEATPHLCAARDAPEEDIRVDVRGLIDTHGVACP